MKTLRVRYRYKKRKMEVFEDMGPVKVCRMRNTMFFKGSTKMGPEHYYFTVWRFSKGWTTNGPYHTVENARRYAKIKLGEVDC